MNILLIANTDKENCRAVAEKIIAALSGYPCNYFSDSKELLYNEGITKIGSLSEIDAAITIGGDGTLLHSADMLSKHNIPVLGVNLGRLGYLAELETSEIYLLSKLFEKRFDIEKRMLLDIGVLRKNRAVYKVTALNDGVISNGNLTKLLDMELYCDERQVTVYRADGLVLSTPTGSTAYSLSAGGPVIAPGLALIAVTPICAHSLSARPVIFDATSKISIKIPVQRLTGMLLNVDGAEGFPLLHEDIVEVRKSKRVLKTIKLKGNNFYQTLNAKFSGGERA